MQQHAYSDTELLAWLDKLADGDIPPLASDLNDIPDAPSPGTYANRFGSFHDAIRAAGYQVPAPRTDTWGQETLLEWIHELADGDTPPTTTDLNNHPDAPPAPLYYERFKSFHAALRTAGYDPERPPGEYSRDELLHWLNRLADGNSPPTLADLNDHPDAPSPTPYYTHFDSFNQALAAAGYEPHR